MDGALLLAFAVTLGAGLATGIGSTIAFFAKTTNKSFFAVSMGFSAGVMIYLSFVEILPKSTIYISEYVSEIEAAAIAAAAAVAVLAAEKVADYGYETPIKRKVK